jgi:hypothetical protein
MAKKAAKPTTKKAASKTTKASAKKVSPKPATKAPAVSSKPTKKASKKASKKAAAKPSSELLLTTEDIKQLVNDLRKRFPKPEKDLIVEVAIDDQHVADATPGPKKGEWLVMAPGSCED